MMLRGVITRSFGNLICLRGFAPYIDLAKMSAKDESYQRDEIKTHGEDIVAFLDSGEYTFFPEVILGGSLQNLGFDDDEIAFLYNAVKNGDGVKRKKFGKISATIIVKEFKRGGQVDRHLTGSLYDLEMMDKSRLFSRIDGNHRLQAVLQAKSEVQRYLVPFCLVLFRTDEECKRFGRVFFHMINFRAIPISEEKNLKLILDENDFELKRLLRPPFGLEFYLARKCLRDDTFLQSRIATLPHSALLEMFRYLISHHKDFGGSGDASPYWQDMSDEDSVIRCANRFFHEFFVQVSKLDNLLRNNAQIYMLCDANKNILASLLVVLLCMQDDYSEYISWLLAREREDTVESLLNGSIEWIVNLFKTGQEKRKRRVFVSMQFGSCGTEQNFSTIQNVVDEINKNNNLTPPLEIVRIDKFVTGETFEINEQIINHISQCGYLIADLTYCNSNVYHEIGMLMGRTLALTDKHEYNMTLILDTQVSEEKKIVKFNLKSLQYLAFSKQKELRDGIRKRLEKFYGL